MKRDDAIPAILASIVPCIFEKFWVFVIPSINAPVGKS